MFSSHIIFVFYFRNVEDEEEASPSDCLRQAEANGSDNYNKMFQVSTTIKHDTQRVIYPCMRKNERTNPLSARRVA